MDVFVVEGVEFGGLEVDDTDDPVLHEQRYGEFGAHRADDFEIARLVANVTHVDRLFRGGRHTGDAFIERDREVGNQGGIETDGTADAEAPVAIRIEQDGGDVEADYVTDHADDGVEEIVEVERGRDYGGNLEEEVE
ncbi:MAG: hypothetical protein ABIR92_03410 [Gemmatimonadaceae bacterium]